MIPNQAGDSALSADAGVTVAEGVIWLSNARLALGFSLSSGRWLSICRGSPGGTAGAVDLTAAGEGMPLVLLRVGGQRAYEGVVRTSRAFELVDAQEIGWQTRLLTVDARPVGQGMALELACAEGDWRLTAIFYLAHGTDTVVRSLRLAYGGEGEVLLRDARLPLPPLAVRDERPLWVEAPGYPVVSHVAAADLPEGVWPGLDSRTQTAPGQVQHAVDAPGSQAGLVGVYDPADRAALLLWPFSTTEFSILELEKRADGLRFCQWLLLAERAARGVTVEVGEQFARSASGEPAGAGVQYLRLAQSGWDEILAAWQPWFETVGLSVPTDRPAWAEGTAIYEAHVGRAPFLGGLSYQPYPTVDDLARDLPRIRGLGFEVLQLMPHWPFCGYTVHRYEDIDTQYGQAGPLKEMIQAAHHLGLRVILDVVLHGAIDREIVRWNMQQFGPRYDFIFGEWLVRADECSWYRQQHPEWFMQDEDGGGARVYTWAFDHAHPGFQEYLVNVLRSYLDGLGVDGFRFDAPTWNSMPNWRRGQPDRPSAAYYASHPMLLRVRQALKASHPQALLFTEPGGPLFRSSMDLTYNYDEEWLSGSLLEVVSPRGYAGSRTCCQQPLTASQVAAWMHHRQQTLPPGSETVHHLDSHDTFWWGELAQFRREAFGDQAARAMFAFFALCGGGIMVYAGAEQGSEDFYRALLHLRQGQSALRRGTCDFLAVRSDHPRVLAWLRAWQDQRLIVVIHLGAQPVQTALHILPGALPLDGAAHCLVADLLAGEGAAQDGERRLPVDELTHLPLDLPPFAVRVLRVTPAPGG